MRRWAGRGIGAGLVALAAACTSFGAASTTTTDDAGVVDGGVIDGARAASDAGEPYAQTVLDDKPLAYFRLSDGAGDATSLGSVESVKLAYGPGVTRSAPGLIATDPNDTAAHFGGQDGPGNFITGPMNAGLQPSAAISVECWFRRDGDTPLPDASAGRDPFQYLISYDQRQVYPFQAYVLQLDGNSPSYHQAAGGTTVDDNIVNVSASNARIHHLVATYDGADVVVYLDGASISTEATSGTLDYDSVLGLDIGGDSTTSSSVFNGTLDEVAIYDQALTSARVLAHYQAGTGQR